MATGVGQHNVTGLQVQAKGKQHSVITAKTSVEDFLAPLNIGGVLIDPPLMLAPMAGHSTHALRQLCREGGACGLVTTELISSRAMHYPSSQQATFDLFDWTPAEHPVAVQLFGADPQEMATARLAASNCSWKTCGDPARLTRTW